MFKFTTKRETIYASLFNVARTFTRMLHIIFPELQGIRTWLLKQEFQDTVVIEPKKKDVSNELNCSLEILK